MGRFRKRSQVGPVDTLLDANRPVPRAEFASVIVERVESERRLHVRGGRRLVLAVVLTALAVGAAAAAGGVKAASDGVGSLVDVAKKTVVSPPQANSSSSQGNQQGVNQSGSEGGNQQGDNQANQGVSAGDQQYAVTICHATGSVTNPYVELTLSPQGAAQHLLNHLGDFILAAGGSCPSKVHPSH
jgi:hypothetical protein